MKKKVKMKLLKITKSAVMYGGTDYTLYAKKNGLPEVLPENLTVEISFTK